MRIRYASTLAIAVSVSAWVTGGARAQDLHIPLPTDSLELLLESAPLAIRNLQGTRFQGDRTSRANLDFADGTSFMAKLAPAPPGGEVFNNVPRFELAAYRVQWLFLEEPEIVVPPTAVRAFPLDWYRALDGSVEPTFRGAASVVVLMQYWLSFVTAENVWDEDRFEADSVYARHWANLNLLTYLIRHSDSVLGNLLISNFPNNPRVFAVDNGVAFNSIESARGTRWRNLLVDRFPARTVERLRDLTEQDLHDALGVLAQWVIEDGELVPTARTANIDPRRGIRQRDGVIQIGLSRDDIGDTWRRLESFLSGVDSGMYGTF